MGKLLEGMSAIKNLIDDIFVYTETFQYHLQVLSNLFVTSKSHSEVSKYCFAYQST